MTNAHLLGLPLHPDSAQLGRLTTNRHRPHDDFIDPFPSRPNDTEIQKRNQNNLHDIRESTNQFRWNINLGFLARLRSSKSGTGTAKLSAQRTTTQELKNSKQWFEDACLQPKTRRWLEKAAKDKSHVYLIVGSHSAWDAKIISAYAGAGGSGGAATPHAMASWVSLALPPHPVGSLVTLPHLMGSQLTVGTGNGWGGGGDMGFTAEGEQVFAVLYREVQTGRFSKNVDKMVLKAAGDWVSVWDWGSTVTGGGYAISAGLSVPVGSNPQLLPVLLPEPLPEGVDPQGQVIAVRLGEKEGELDTREDQLVQS